VFIGYQKTPLISATAWCNPLRSEMDNDQGDRHVGKTGLISSQKRNLMVWRN